MNCRQLLAWLEEPSSHRGIHFAQTGEAWDFWTYERLALLTRRVESSLLKARVEKDDVVAIVQRSGPEFVATFFATLLAGATPAPLAPPLAFRNPEMYEAHLTDALLNSRPSLVATHADLLGDIGRLAATAGVTSTHAIDYLLLNNEAPTLADRDPARFALLQFTSGSTGRSRGVRISFDALENNVKAIRKWLQWTNDVPFASWLPLHHDMGLVGGLVSAVVGGSDLWLLQPEQFIRRPLRYLQCFGALGARLSVTANFGLEYILRRVRQEQLEGLDFSDWQGVVIGAERIDAGALDAFYALLAPFGFRRHTLLPAYGMAEATLAVTGLPLQDEWKTVTVESSSLSIGREIVVGETGNTQTVVGCGRALDGISIVIVDERGRPLPDGWVGEITVLGRSLATGYIEDSRSPSLTHFRDTTLHTGDAGFVVGGQLFVLGRLGDSMKVRGQVVFGEDLETALVPVGVSRHQLVALLGPHKGVPTAVVVFERFNQQWQETVETILHQRTAGAQIVLVHAPKGTITRTSSGKPKRLDLWRAFVQGVLPGRVIKDTPADSHVR